MIGVDTNVLVRLLVRDNAVQLDAATRFMAQRSSDDPAFVSSVVVAELAWVLDKSYGYAPEAIHTAMDWLFESQNIVVERSALVEDAVHVAREGKADISDAIIAALSEDAGAAKTVTFDKPAAKRVPGMELLA
jgi:predicted nucleic-acid-binding protein